MLRSLRLGARGYVTKAEGLRDLAETLRRVVAGERAIAPALEQDAVLALGRFVRRAREGDEVASDLTARERQVLELLSELVEPKLRFLVEPDIPSIRARVRLRSGDCIDMHCVHPRPPAPTEASSSVERDAELLIVAKMVAATDRPAIVVGDLNDVAWSATTRLFQKVSGMLDPRVGRGMFSTFHAKHVWLRWPLDHIFISPEFTVVSLARLGYFGSDHFPMQARLCYTPRAAAVQNAPEPGANDHDVAEEKIAKAATKS